MLLKAHYHASADIALPSNTPALVLAAGLEALARRASGQPRRQIRATNLTIDSDARTAQVDDQPLKLTRLEFDLLHTLATQPHKTFTRAELTQQVWGYDPKAAGPSRTIDSHSSRLRQKLAQAGAGQLIHTPAVSAGDSPAESGVRQRHGSVKEPRRFPANQPPVRPDDAARRRQSLTSATSATYSRSSTTGSSAS